MREFTILMPHYTIPERRLLRAMLTRSKLPWREPITDLHDSPLHVLSVGKAALDTWHQYGLIRVGAHHGHIFHHQPASAAQRTITIMQLEHPSTLMQLSITGYTAKTAMLDDLVRWRRVIEGDKAAVGEGVMGSCAKCAAGNKPARRDAYYWPANLDGIGLCEDHYRKRARIVKKGPKKVTNRGKKEAQMKGQLEMCADGRTIVTPKN